MPTLDMWNCHYCQRGWRRPSQHCSRKYGDCTFTLWLLTWSSSALVCGITVVHYGLRHMLEFGKYCVRGLRMRGKEGVGLYIGLAGTNTQLKNMTKEWQQNEQTNKQATNRLSNEEHNERMDEYTNELNESDRRPVTKNSKKQIHWKLGSWGCLGQGQNLKITLIRKVATC